MTITTCDDCGRTIFLVRPGAKAARWAHTVGKAHVFMCRFEMGPDGRLLSADYHHPADEVGATFVAKTKP